MTTISLPSTSIGWHDVVDVSQLLPDRGVAALVEGVQVAIFLLPEGEVHAIDNRDPISGANVLSRGIVGDRAGRVVVASPLFKQCFELSSGLCLDDPDHRVAVHDARVVDGRVHVRLAHP
ncbi:MAG: nitrite reductase small subunit NirD [Actinomycetota bacterium]|nr:nitrite reductase small subunit NirD [Actinomycetota bacterium]